MREGTAATPAPANTAAEPSTAPSRSTRPASPRSATSASIRARSGPSPAITSRAPGVTVRAKGGDQIRHPLLRREPPTRRDHRRATAEFARPDRPAREGHGIVDPQGPPRIGSPVADQNRREAVRHADDPRRPPRQPRQPLVAEGGQSPRPPFLEAVIADDEGRPPPRQRLREGELHVGYRDGRGRDVVSSAPQQSREPPHPADVPGSELDHLDAAGRIEPRFHRVDGQRHAVPARGERSRQGGEHALGPPPPDARVWSRIESLAMSAVAVCKS